LHVYRVTSLMHELPAAAFSAAGNSYHNPDAPFVEISAAALPPPVASALSTLPQAKDESCMNDWMYDIDTLTWQKCVVQI